MASIVIRCLRPCLHAGHALSAGEVVNVDPLVAATMLDSGRCELVRQDDRGAVDAARRDDVRKVLGEMRQVAAREGAGWARRWA